MMYLVGTAVLAFCFATAALLAGIPMADRFGLLDLPTERKVHSGAVPLVGGLSVFVGLTLAWLIAMPFNRPYGVFLLCSFFLVVLGALDDARNIPAKFRLWAQVVLGSLLVYGADRYLNTFGNLLGSGALLLGWLGPVVTVCAVIGATNAFNMIDGIDGLLGSVSLVAFCSLIVLFASAGPGFRMELTLAVALVVAMVPYMLANLRMGPFRNKVFMGDAGAMFIGLSLVWLLVNGTQAEAMAFRPVTALWIIGLPLMDMLAIMIRRYRKGQSVMMADRDHLHHIFLRAGCTNRQALVLITAVAGLLAVLGLLGEFLHIPEWLMFSGILLVFIGYNVALNRVWRLLAMVRRT